MKDKSTNRLALFALLLYLSWVDIVAAADAIPGEEFCVGQIADIRFAGNRKTKPQYLERELAIKRGDICSLDDIIDSTQNIMNLGLFKSARAILFQDDNALTVMFTVEEKFSFFLIPRLSRTSDAELRAGLQMRWDNLHGRLHNMRITSEVRQKDDGNGLRGFVHRLEYDVPRFLNTSYGLGLGLFLERRRRDLEQSGLTFGRALSDKQQFELLLSRWVNKNQGLQGLRYFFGLRFDARSLQLESGGLGPFTEGHDMSFVLGAETRLVQQDFYRRRGSVSGVVARFASTGIGSDFSYSRLDLYSRWYIPLSGLRNLNIQTRIGLSDGAPFGEHHFSLGGGELIRGLETNSVSGDMLALVNVEYLTALFSHPQWRWVAFADAGNAYERGNVNLARQELRVGMGLRLKIESISNTDIRLDIAWDAERQRLQTFVSSNLTF